jgi:hypothetical protein
MKTLTHWITRWIQKTLTSWLLSQTVADEHANTLTQSMHQAVLLHRLSSGVAVENIHTGWTPADFAASLKTPEGELSLLVGILVGKHTDHAILDAVRLAMRGAHLAQQNPMQVAQQAAEVAKFLGQPSTSLAQPDNIPVCALPAEAVTMLAEDSRPWPGQYL